MMGTATRHLILDSLWRGRMAWLWVGACVLVVWVVVAMGLDAKAGMVASLIGVFVLGPMMSLTSVMVRETRFLPVTSRDVWLVAWLLSTLVATTFVVALQALGLGIGMAAGFPQPHALSSLAFMALCAFAYGGALLPVGPFIGYTSHAATERRPKWLWVALATLTFLTYFGGLVMPWAAWAVLPISFADLTWWSASALMIGIVAAIGAVMWTPQRFGGMSRPATNAGATRSTSLRAQPAAPSIPRGADRLTGLNRLLFPSLARVFVIAVAAAGAAMLYVHTFMPATSLYQAFAELGLLPFSAAGFSPRVILGTAMFAPFMALSGGLAWDGHTRHLRVLPMSAADTTGLLLATTLMAWALVWMVLLGVHVVVLGFGPSTLRPELFLYLSGMSTLVEASWRGRKKPGFGLTLTMLPMFMLVMVVEILGSRYGVTVMFWTHVIAGGTALVIAAAWTFRSLTRSGSSARVYQSSRPSFTA